MDHWTFQILRQSGWDRWVLVCTVAAIVLATYAVTARRLGARQSWIIQMLTAAGLCGTLAVVAVPAMHTALIGLIWTFSLLSVLSIVFYNNLLPRLGAGRTWTLLGMRVVALALLVPMLFEPVVRRVTRSRPDRPLVILVDTSGSMSFPDVQNGPSRIQAVWQTVGPQLSKIDDHFIPRFFTFSTGIAELPMPRDLATLTADGKATDVVQAVSTALTLSTREDASYILISDGNDNASPNVVDALRASRRPINTVCVGSEQAEPSSIANIAVDNVDTGDDFVVNHDSKIKATIKSTALANRVVEVKLAEIGGDGKPMSEVISSKLVLQPNPAGQVVELPYRPKIAGVHKLAVWVDPVPGERSIVDNRQEFQGLALDPRIKVLYVEGRLRPEYTNINRALLHDPNIEEASLLRLQADRFAAAGSVDGEPLKGMPRTTDEWKKFDVIILGDLDSTFLTHQQQDGIEQAVDAGAGLLMIGGQNSLGPGGYKGTSIEKALPVTVGPIESAQEKSEFVPRLTAEGSVHPAMEGLQPWFGSEQKVGEQTLPPLRGNVVVAGVKGGAQVLLTHSDRLGPDGKPQVVLAVERYGKGRSAAFTADTTYLWYIALRGMGQESPYNRFWGQLVRWLAGEDVRNRQHGAGIEGLLNKSTYQLGESVRIRAMVRDDKGDATRYAQVRAVVKTVQGEAKQLPLTPVDSRLGLYDVTIPTPDKGDYTAELIAEKDGKELGRQKLHFTVIPPADEMLKIAANPALMRAIAEQTRGADGAPGLHCQLAQFPNMIDDLIRADANAVTEKQETVPLSNTLRSVLALLGKQVDWARKYDLPMQAALVVLLLSGEWILRRKWQLP